MMITNQSASKKRIAMKTESVFLYRAHKEDWSYCHHASLCFFQDRFYAMWSNGHVNEDDCGQRVLICSSADAQSWTKPEPLFDSSMGKYNPEVLTAAGFHVFRGQLTAYAGCYEYAPENIHNGHYIKINTAHQNTRLLAKTTADGVRWSEPVNLHLPVVPNHGPQPLHNGRLLIAGGIAFPYSDVPDGLSGWHMGGIYPADWTDIFDDSEAIQLCQTRMNRDVFLCEGSFYQTDDDIIHMFLRSDKNVLWAADSRDNGATWGRPYATEFSNCNTKFHAGRLPDGRFYLVGNPDPKGNRCPLVISTSPDGKNFDREYILADRRTEQRISGLHKTGIYGYPHSLVLGGRFYVICSVHKEDILLLSCALSELI